jgi:hypothetical protein
MKTKTMFISSKGNLPIYCSIIELNNPGRYFRLKYEAVRRSLSQKRSVSKDLLLSAR